MRGKKALFNSASALFVEVVSLICGFVLPKAILSAFGSAYNGLTTSITQFLSLVTLLRAGVGGVIRAALYKPLADNNHEAINGIVNATQRFMKKIALIFAVGLFGFAFVYPLFVRDSFEYWFSCALVLIMGIATFVQYYFAITYQMLVTADQRQYIIAIVQGITLLLNLLVSIVLIRQGCGIHVVKLGSAVVYCVNPIITAIYVKRKYKLNANITPDSTPISQRWDAFAHQVAAFFQENTDVMILTVFSSVTEVSVYAVYFLVTNGLKKMLATFTVGIESVFGNMIALSDFDGLRRNMRRVEYLVFSLGTVAYSCLIILMVPFVRIYTSGIIDVEYSRPVFALVLAVAQFICCVRTPYQNLVDAAGHFKQTRNSAVIEAGLNILISIVLVIWLGLVGVVIGTLISTLYRTIYLVVYASKNILKIANYNFVKRGVCSFMQIVLVCILAKVLVNVTVTDYFSWFVWAVAVCLIAVAVVLVFSLIFDRRDLFDFAKKIWSIISGHSK